MRMRNPSDAEDSYNVEIKSTNSEIFSEGTPVDHGYSWVVCFSVFAITLLQFGHDQAIFVLFVDFVEEFQQSASVMTSMFTIFSLTSALSSLATSNLLMPHFSTRQITCAAAILGSTFTLVLSRSPNVYWVLVVFGLKGTCFGALLVSPTSLLGYYFHRRRSFATALSNTGLCAAFILFPGFTQVLREAFGLRGALLVLAAIELHILALGMLLRPVGSSRNNWKSLGLYRSVHLAQELKPLNSASANDNLSLTGQPRTLHTTEDGKAEKHHEDPLDISTDYDMATAGADNVSGRETSYPPLPNPVCRFNSADMLKEYSAIDSNKNRACDERHKFRSITTGAQNQNADGKDKQILKTCWENPRDKAYSAYKCPHGSIDNCQRQPNRVEGGKGYDAISVSESTERRKKLFDFSLLKIWPFRMTLLANGLGTFASYVNIYMPTMAVRAGLTRGQAVSLLTVVGAVDLCSRIVLGYLADTGLVAKTKIVAVCLACISTLCHLVRLYSTYTHFLVYAACVGLTCGCRHNLLNVILIEHVGVARLAQGLGLCSLLNTSLLAANHPVIGALLDATGSFVVPMHYVGSVVLVGSLLYLAEPIFVKLETRRIAKNELRRRSSATATF